MLPTRQGKCFFFLVSNVTVKLFFLFFDRNQCFLCIYLYFRILGGIGNLSEHYFSKLGTVIRDKQRSNKMQLEKNVAILLVFTVTPSKTKIKTVECMKLRISDIIEYR